MSRAGFEYKQRKTEQTAETRSPPISAKRVSTHVTRHTCALTILQATKDLRKVSLWLGHSSMQTTEIYTRADPSVKLEALEIRDRSEAAHRPFQGNGQTACPAESHHYYAE